MGRNISLMMERAGAYVTVGLSTMCALTVTATTVEYAGASATAKSYRVSGYVYGIDVERLYDGDAIAVGDSIRWVMELGGRDLTGIASVAHVSPSASVDGYAVCSVRLQGVGAVGYADVDSWDLRDASVTIADIIDLADAASVADGVIDFVV